eukprot:m.117866 g.117866  ORF g.117866 m.117866 type:complete len:438 (+) comp9217_c0_seq8:1255-2568(+)
MPRARRKGRALRPEQAGSAAEDASDGQKHICRRAAAEAPGGVDGDVVRHAYCRVVRGEAAEIHSAQSGEVCAERAAQVFGRNDGLGPIECRDVLNIGKHLLQAGAQRLGLEAQPQPRPPAAHVRAQHVAHARDSVVHALCRGVLQRRPLHGRGQEAPQRRRGLRLHADAEDAVDEVAERRDDRVLEQADVGLRRARLALSGAEGKPGHVLDRLPQLREQHGGVLVAALAQARCVCPHALVRENRVARGSAVDLRLRFLAERPALRLRLQGKVLRAERVQGAGDLHDWLAGQRLCPFVMGWQGRQLALAAHVDHGRDAAHVLREDAARRPPARRDADGRGRARGLGDGDGAGRGRAAAEVGGHDGVGCCRDEINGGLERRRRQAQRHRQQAGIGRAACAHARLEEGVARIADQGDDLQSGGPVQTTGRAHYCSTHKIA